MAAFMPARVGWLWLSPSPLSFTAFSPAGAEAEVGFCFFGRSRLMDAGSLLISDLVSIFFFFFVRGGRRWWKNREGNGFFERWWGNGSAFDLRNLQAGNKWLLKEFLEDILRNK
jgi:hypothetical protein